MKRYLVTGAAGFIGSSIAKKLVGDGNEIWTIDNLSTGFKENIPKGVVLIEGGCQEPDSIKQLNGVRFNAVFHLAGQSSGEISFDDPVYDLRTNTESTLRLINYCLENGCKRFIYTSSMSVYGEVEDKPIPEDHVTKPLSFYGVGKLASENYMRIYESKGLEPTSLRFFNVYGPGQNMSNLRQGMVSIYLAQLLREDKVIVKGPLDRFRDFVFIDDCLDLMMGIIEDERSYGGIFNVGTGVKTTVEELLEKMMEISGVRKKIVIEKGTPGDQKGIYADISLAVSKLGFKYKHSLDNGLAKMIQWAKGFIG
ncbi:MAG: NAD-dependent epimerase/dehydratase family protein [Candidatus Hodarchaeota archaeon]